jgi:hypothetical protein
MCPKNICSTTLRILEDEPECICCPVMDVCRESDGEPVTITREINKRSNCGGAEFDTWDDVKGFGGEP